MGSFPLLAVVGLVEVTSDALRNLEMKQHTFEMIGGNAKVGFYWRPPGADMENVHKMPTTPQGEYSVVSLAN